jgi:hypothetical protein
MIELYFIRESEHSHKNGGSDMKLVIVLAVLSTLLLATLAVADTQMATSVIASGGGQASSTNFRLKATLGQSTPIGPSSSTNFGVRAGFWYQDPVAPSAIGDLSAQLAISDIVLQWSHAADNVAIDHYVVYRGTDPAFVPSGGNSIHQTKETSYQDPGAAGTMGTDYFYVVKATDPAGNLAEDSNRVGEFDRDTRNSP